MLEFDFNKLVKKVRGYNVPYSLSLEGWDEWERKTKEDFPIRYFLFETCRDKIEYYLYRLNNIKWWFLHRLHPKHRYHIVKTDLKPGYYDSDTRILHACFNELNNFVENCAGGIDWRESSDQHFEAYCTMKELWYWWNCIRPIEWENLENSRPFSFEKEGGLVIKDNEQLKKLAEIRHFLWC